MDQSKVNLERIRACDAGWEESKHPRAENGQFTSGGGGIHPMAAGSKATIRSKEGKRLTHNAKVYQRTARLAKENYAKKHGPEMEAQAGRVEAAKNKLMGQSTKLAKRAQRELARAPEGPERNKKMQQYGSLMGKTNERYGGQYSKEMDKLSEMSRKQGDYNSKMDRNVSERNANAAAYNSRTITLQALATALHQSHPELFKGGRVKEAAPSALRPMPAGSKATIRSKEGKRLTHNAKNYAEAAREEWEHYKEKHDPLIAAQEERRDQVESQGRKNQKNLEYRQFREGYDPKRAPQYHHLFNKMQYRDQNRYLAEQGKLDKMKRDRGDAHENLRIASQVRADEARRYNDRTRKLQEQATALHSAHPEAFKGKK